MSGEHYQQGGFTEQPQPSGPAEGTQGPKKVQPPDALMLRRLVEALKKLPDDDKPAAEATVEDAKALREDLGDAAPDYRVVSPLAPADIAADAGSQGTQNSWEEDAFGWFKPHTTEESLLQERRDRHQVRLAKILAPVPPVSRGLALSSNEVERLALPATPTPVPEFDPTIMSWDRTRKAQTAEEAHGTANRIHAAYERSRTFPQLPAGARVLQFDPLTTSYSALQKTSTLILQEPVYDALLGESKFQELNSHLSRTTQGRHARRQNTSGQTPAEVPQSADAIQPETQQSHASQVNKHAQVAIMRDRAATVPQVRDGTEPPVATTIHSIATEDQPRPQQMLMRPVPPPAGAVGAIEASSSDTNGLTPLPDDIHFPRRHTKRIEGPAPFTNSSPLTPNPALESSVRLSLTAASETTRPDESEPIDLGWSITGPENLEPVPRVHIPSMSSRPVGGTTTYAEGFVTLRRQPPAKSKRANGGGALYSAETLPRSSKLWPPEAEPVTGTPDESTMSNQEPAVLHFADGSHIEVDMSTPGKESAPARRILGKLGRSALLGAGIFAAGVWAGRRRR